MNHFRPTVVRRPLRRRRNPILQALTFVLAVLGLLVGAAVWLVCALAMPAFIVVVILILVGVIPLP